MTSLLLDTNAFAMTLTGDIRLPNHSRAMIEAADRVGVSAISFYEIGRKVRLGKWAEMAALVDVIEQKAIDLRYDLLRLTVSAARDAALLDWTHRDPFDRIIAATALQEGAALVSSDRVFDQIGVERVWE